MQKDTDNASTNVSEANHSTQQAGKETEAAVGTAVFQFVSYSPTRSSKARSGSSIVRSQAARHHWGQYAATRGFRNTVGGRRPKAVAQIVLEGQEQSGLSSEKRPCSATEENSTTEEGSVPSSSTPPWPTIEALVLSGTRVDPFKSFPAKYRSFFPVVIDHCKFCSRIL
jgi:hypothetical protein